MGFFIGLLTFVLVLDCIALILLVLMQLPKKDAGVGVAFGGGATDALFGAGSGNVLTKATKYSATIFFILALVIGVLQNKYHNRSVTELMNASASQSSTLPSATPAPATTTPAATEPAAQPMTIPASTNFMLETTPPAEPAPEQPSEPAPSE